MPLTAADSYTTQAQVEALVRRGAYTASTNPTNQEVLDRMAQQAARITAVLERGGHGGTPATVKGGSDTTLDRLCAECNAFLAAAYVLLMHDQRDTDKAVHEAYLSAGMALLGTDDMPGAIEVYVEASYPALATSAAVNTEIEIEAADLHHVTELRF